MLPPTMSQGTDASKDAESAAKADESQSEENRTIDSASSRSSKPSPEQSLTEPSSEGGSDGDENVTSAKPSKASRVTEELLIPETEEALNVPKTQTIGMLGAISTLTLIAWFAARLACNAHPDQVREPKHFSTKDLAADPKNAAFEFHHSFETGDFVTALDLASGEVKTLVEGKLIECENSPDACEENRSRLAGTVNSTGRVLDQIGARSTVELTSYYSKQPEPKTFQFSVEKQGDYYRVLSRKQVANAVPAAQSMPVSSAGGAAEATAPAQAPVLPGNVSEESSSVP